MFVAEEYGAFDGSQRRIDLLAVDRTGQLVVIELKRTADGGIWISRPCDTRPWSPR